MAELSDQAKALLERARRGAARPEPAARARVRARVEASLAGTGPDASTLAGTGKPLLLTKIALVSTLLLLGLAALRRGDPAPDPGPPPAATSGAALEASRAAASSDPAAVAAAERAPSSAPKQASAGPPLHDARPTLQAELALLDRATRAVFAGDLRQARKLLEAHQRRFRHSQLLEERAGLGVLADCIDDPVRAKPSGMAFVRAHPAGVLTGRIERACDLARHE